VVNILIDIYSNDQTITGLTINRPGKTYVGLFGHIGEGDTSRVLSMSNLSQLPHGKLPFLVLPWFDGNEKIRSQIEGYENGV
jgi:hypothetical protein